MSLRRNPSISANTDVPDLDRRYMERLQNHIGPATLGAMLDDAMLELADRLSRVAELAQDRDADQLAMLAHSVAGVAGHVGLTALSIAAADLSRTARAVDTAGLAALDRAVASLLDAKDPALDAIAAYRAEQPKPAQD